MTSVRVRGSHMHFVESGTGPVVLFLHGNPTSSYLWRNVTGPMSAQGYRCLALDLIGMGRSGPSISGYRLTDHIAYVDAFLDVLHLGDVTVVGHDWGAVVALDLARRHSSRIRGVAVMEGHIHPIDSWAEMESGARELFSAVRAVGVGEQMVLVDNVFVEVVLPSGIERRLTATEMGAYRRPFDTPAARIPILQWAREVPIEGEPADVVSIVTDNQSVLVDPAMPTLMMHGSPGALIGAPEVDWCRTHGHAMTVTDVGNGTHFLPEDQPRAIADALLTWIRGS